jgi:hypothetical protein
VADWCLNFQRSEPSTIEECERVLSGIAGPVTTTLDSYSGNPRDFYLRTITLTAEPGRSGLRIELVLYQHARAPDDPDPILSAGITIALRGTSALYATKLATWHALRDALARIGFTDRTIDMKPTMIVDDANAAGDVATATRLRAEIAVVREAAVRVSSPPTPPPAAKPVVDRDPPPPQVTFDAGALEVTGMLDATSLRTLIESGAYRSATKVGLAWTALHDTGVAYLARSGGFPSVIELKLGRTGMTDEGATALATTSVGLDFLETLDLGDVPEEPNRWGTHDRSGVSDHGVDELARSSRLPALRRIIRRKDHRPPSYRNDTEIIEIRRADGRVVESVIEHSSSP